MTNHKSITELLAKWDELREQGIEASPDKICETCPDALDSLKARIGELKAMDWLDDSDDEFVESVQLPEDRDEPRFGDTKIPVVLGGRYEMESLIAEGGFAQVWRAFDKNLERHVAIKVTTINCHAEARRVAQLRHQGIIAVHDAGNSDGLCYIVFDLIEGDTLADRIRTTPIPWHESVRIIVDVSRSVQFAHEKGFIHRDIKPSNILLDELGKPVLADFGIAVTECELRNESVTSLGTLAYMAPEQFEIHGTIDARTDVYGLGVVFYEMLTGKLPFTDRTLHGLRNEILAGNVRPPRFYNSEIPEVVERVCLKCLRRSPDDRYQTAKELADELLIRPK